MSVQTIQPQINNLYFYRQQAITAHVSSLVPQCPSALVPLNSPALKTSQTQPNYCSFNQQKVDYFVKQKEQALPYLSDILAHSNNEAQITETLYIVDRMIDGGTKGVDKMYPVLSRFNQTNSPFIQTFLAGIYRKIQVPDAFGPLVAMLIRNSVNPPQTNFDPNEEVGGAILAYLSDRFRK